jgi:capsule polysaccharide export protein KpsE/RkpR
MCEKKRCFFLLFALLFFLQPAFSQGVFLTEAEFQELLNIIRASKANSEAQTNLIAGLRETLTTQEAALLRALSSLGQSETDLTELKASLSRIRSYSDELNAYCLTLEQENAALRTENRRLKIGLGISSGSAGALVIVLIILLL